MLVAPLVGGGDFHPRHITAEMLNGVFVSTV